MITSLQTDETALLPRLLLLTDTEREVAAILSFDPDATIPAGALHPYRDEARTNPIPADAMDSRAWRMLARACAPTPERDEEAAFAQFLAERSSLVGVAPSDAIGLRVKPRPRVGGDRYAGRAGEIVRAHFAGFYVRLDMTPRERTQKTELVDTDKLELLPARASA